MCRKKEILTSSAEWKIIRHITKFFVRNKEGQRKDPETIIEELEYLLDIRDYVLHQRSHGATEQMSPDLTQTEVSRCYYIWGTEFLENHLSRGQEHLRPTQESSKWPSKTRSFIRAMFQKSVGHLRLAMAVFQLGLPLKTFPYKPSTDARPCTALSCTERAKFDIQLIVDFVIQIGVAERKHCATEEYNTTVHNMSSYKQPSENPSNNKTRKKLWVEMRKAEELQERRDWYGWDGLEDWEQRILQDYETGTLKQKLRQVGSGCMPRPLFFRVQP